MIGVTWQSVRISRFGGPEVLELEGQRTIPDPGPMRLLFDGRHAAWYSTTDRRLTHPEEFKADMATLFSLLRGGAIHPVVVDRLPLIAARAARTTQSR